MKKKIIGILAVMMAMSVGIAFAGDGTLGNGAPQAPKAYSFNIIGVPGDKNPDMTDNNGHRIFVPLEGKIKILLSEGDYAVLDANGTDGIAAFRLPDPDLDPYIVGDDMTGIDTDSAYSVFVRPLGPPGGWATITTCADLVESNFMAFLGNHEYNVISGECDLGGYASVEQVGQLITERKPGKSEFTNVTAELLTILLRVEILDDEGEVIRTVYVRIPIFDDLLENEYWEYDNHGLKILQVRFYVIPTDVSENDPT